MERKNYRRLGDFIRTVDVRNKNLQCSNLLGLSVSKIFIPSIANTIGTNMSSYKIVKRGQFVYIPDTSRRGDKIAIALLTDYDEAIVSQVYTVFEITDTRSLLPEYLMLWFRRPEFDRYARFKSIGSAREVFDWNEMCDVELPVPPISEQQKVVSQYQTIENRITINNGIIQKLEDAAQAIYRKMFVEDVDPENLPEGWRIGTLTEIADYLNGIACQKYETKDNAYYPVLKIKELSQGYTDETSNHVSLDIPPIYIINDGDVIFSWSATLLIDFWCGGTCALNQHLFKVTSTNYPKWFYYFATKEHIEAWKKIISAKAVSMGHIKREDLESAEIVIPNDRDLKIVDHQIQPIIKYILDKRKEVLLDNEVLKLIMNQIN